MKLKKWSSVDPLEFSFHVHKFRCVLHLQVESSTVQFIQRPSLLFRRLWRITQVSKYAHIQRQFLQSVGKKS